MVRSLVERGAIGMVSTHDLALARFLRRCGGRAANATSRIALKTAS